MLFVQLNQDVLLLPKMGKQRQQFPTCGQKYITSVVLRTTTENEWGKLRDVSALEAH